MAPPPPKLLGGAQGPLRPLPTPLPGSGGTAAGAHLHAPPPPPAASSPLAATSQLAPLPRRHCRALAPRGSLLLLLLL